MNYEVKIIVLNKIQVLKFIKIMNTIQNKFKSNKILIYNLFSFCILKTLNEWAKSIPRFSVYCNVINIITVTGSYSRGASAVTATILLVWRTDAHTVPKVSYYLARWLPHVNPGRHGCSASPSGSPPSWTSVRHHAIRHTRGPRASAVAS